MSSRRKFSIFMWQSNFVLLVSFYYEVSAIMTSTIHVSVTGIKVLTAPLGLSSTPEVIFLLAHPNINMLLSSAFRVLKPRLRCAVVLSSQTCFWFKASVSLEAWVHIQPLPPCYWNKRAWLTSGLLRYFTYLDDVSHYIRGMYPHHILGNSILPITSIGYFFSSVLFST